MAITDLVAVDDSLVVSLLAPSATLAVREEAAASIAVGDQPATSIEVEDATDTTIEEG